MAAAYASVAAQSVAATTGNVVVTKPAGVVSGDLLVALCWAGNTASTWSATGFTTHTANAAQGSALLTRVADGTEGATITFTRATTSGTAGVILMRFTGANGVSAASVVAGAGGLNTTIDLTSITPTQADTLLVGAVTRTVTSTGDSWTPPGTMSEVFDLNSSGSSNRVAGATQVVGTGATGTRTFTQTGTGGTRGSLFAINPAATSQTITPGSITATSAVGSPTLAPGSVTITPGSITATSVVGAPTLAPGPISVEVAPMVATASIGSPSLLPGSVSIVPGPIAVTTAVGSPTLVTVVYVTPSSIVATTTVGEPTLVAGSITVTPVSIEVTTAVGEPVVLPGAITLSPASIAVTTDVGEPTIIPGEITIAIDPIEVSALVGEPEVVPGEITISPPPILLASSVGTPVVLAISHSGATVSARLLPRGYSSGGFRRRWSARIEG